LPPAAANPAVDLVQAFLDAAKSHVGNQAFSFVMNRLGLARVDPTTEQLRAISAQLRHAGARPRG
jgi:hypothetical protein